MPCGWTQPGDRLAISWHFENQTLNITVTRNDVPQLLEGQFAALKLQGLPEERADYFLDPWNSPYWIRHRCSSERQRIVVYSFGPNRRRDSGPWEPGGDDIGSVIDIEP